MNTHIFHIVSNKVWGGGERYALDLCKALRNNSYKVTAIVRRKSADVAEEFRREGIDTQLLGLGGVLDIFSAIKLSKILDRAADNSDRVVVHIHNFKDATTVLRAKALATAKDKIKIVCTRHLVAPAKTDRSHTELYNALDKIIFVSKLAQDEFLSSKPAIDTARLTVVHNSIIAPEPSPKTASDTLTLLFTGRIVPEKGLETMIRALAKAKSSNIRLNICGTGNPNYITQLRRTASDLDVSDRLNWLGHVDNIWDEISRADIGIMPSTWREPFGLSLIEYMSQGLAVITTSNGAQPEIVTDGKDGLLVAAADVDALATAIDKLAQDNDLRQTLGASARNTYLTRFSYDRFFNAIAEIYKG
jgi:glycosyltransferase involved in cell wall biosynthesis